MLLRKKKPAELPSLEETAEDFTITDGEKYVDEIFESDMKISRSFVHPHLDEEEYEENYARAIKELLATGEHKFFVAIDGYNRYLGHVWVCLRTDTVDFVPVAYIFDIETLFPGRGIGSVLLERAEGWAREKGARKVSLRVELDNPALEWYKRRSYRERAIVLEKEL